MNLGFESPWQKNNGVPAQLEANEKLDFVKNEILCHSAIISQAFKLLPDLKHFDNEIKTIISDSILNEFMILRAAAAHCRYFKGNDSTSWKLLNNKFDPDLYR